MEHTANHNGHINHAHGGHMSHMGNLKRKFIVSLALAIPIILFSPMMGIQLPFQVTFPGSDWVVLILASILFFYGGMPFLSGAKNELKEKRPAMMTLIALGISVAYIYSVYVFIQNKLGHMDHPMDFFWELATLIVIMLLGHWIEMKAVGNAGDALQKMSELLPGNAFVVQENGEIKEVPLMEVQLGQVLLVKSGEKVPADGTIKQGGTNVDESMVTGESREVSKQQGDNVLGGSLNGNGTIQIEVTGTGESGYLAQVMTLVENAQKDKSKAEVLSDKVARGLFFAAVTAAVIALIVWLLVTGSMEDALMRTVTVLVIACPHALGLAIPLVVARSTSLGAKNGLLVRDRKALETATQVNILMMDKTGTLTEGRFEVRNVASFGKNKSEDNVLSLFAALEQGSSHPLATSILQEAGKRGLTYQAADEIQNIPGVGLSGKIGGTDYMVASVSYLDKNKIAYDKTQYGEMTSNAYTISYLLENGKTIGMIAQGDQIKDSAKDLIRELKKHGVVPVMLTGDNEATAKVVAAQLGITDFHASLMPQDKETIIKDYQQKGKTVMMVGDGVNDAPALARADVGVAIGAGTDVAIDSADVVLVRSDPADILHFLALAKNTTRKMKQNLWWGAGYNIVAIPLAAGVLAPIGIILSPAVGAVLMSASTVVVAINALTLRIK